MDNKLFNVFEHMPEEQNPMDTDFGMNMCVIVISCLSAVLADIDERLARKHGAGVQAALSPSLVYIV